MEGWLKTTGGYAYIAGVPKLNIQLMRSNEYGARPWSAYLDTKTGTTWLSAKPAERKYGINSAALRTFGSPEAAAKAALKEWKPQPKKNGNRVRAGKSASITRRVNAQAS